MANEMIAVVKIKDVEIFTGPYLKAERVYHNTLRALPNTPESEITLTVIAHANWQVEYARLKGAYEALRDLWKTNYATGEISDQIYYRMRSISDKMAAYEQLEKQGQSARDAAVRARFIEELFSAGDQFLSEESKEYAMRLFGG